MISISSCQYKIARMPFQAWNQGLYIKNAADKEAYIIDSDGNIIQAEKCIAKMTPAIKIAPEGLAHLAFLIKAIENTCKGE